MQAMDLQGSAMGTKTQVIIQLAMVEIWSIDHNQVCKGKRDEIS